MCGYPALPLLLQYPTHLTLSLLSLYIIMSLPLYLSLYPVQHCYALYCTDMHCNALHCTAVYHITLVRKFSGNIAFSREPLRTGGLVGLNGHL